MEAGADVERLTREAVGYLAREAREALAMDQAEIGDRAGCSGATVSRFESGTSFPSMKNLRRIFAAIRPGLERRGILQEFIALCAECGRAIGGLDDLPGAHTIPAPLPVIPQQPIFLTARPPGDGEAGRDWQSWLKIGRQTAAILDYARAERAYEIAITKARSAGSVAGQARIKAEIAFVTKERSQPVAAWEQTDEVLHLLHLEDRPPESRLTRAEIAERFDDQTMLEAYAKVAEIRGHILNNSDRFRESWATFATLDSIGQELGDAYMRGEARQFQASQWIELGLRYEHDALSWNTAKRPRHLLRAIDALRDARAHHGSNTIRRGHDWRLEAKAWRILGNRDAARRARNEARECFGDNLVVGHLRLEEGIAAAAGGDLKGAVAALETATYLAWELSQPMLLSRSLGFLAESLAALGPEEAAHRSPALYGPALERCFASLIAWPYTFDCRYFRSAATMCLTLFEFADRSVQHAHHLADPVKFPFDLVSDIARSDAGRVAEVVAELRRLA